jgi:hypothetical protein
LTHRNRFFGRGVSKLTFKKTLNGGGIDSQAAYDPFTMSNNAQAVPSAPYNPYLEDSSTIAGAGSAYYPAQATYAATAQPVSRIANPEMTLTLILQGTIPSLCADWPS